MGMIIMNGKEYAGSGSEWHEYSTDEKVVGKWIDGKPLYEKTFHASGNYAKQTEYTFSIGANKEHISIVEGWIDVGIAYVNVNSYLAGGYSIGTFCYISKSDGIHLRSEPWDFTEYFIVLRYTKTTD